MTPSPSPDDVRKAFEQAWAEGRRPRLEDYLPAPGPARLPVLVELVYADLECRLKRGEPARVEDYLRHFPELGSQTDEVLSLIVCECDLRQRREPAFDPQEITQRFPQYSDGVARLLRCLAFAPAVPGYTCFEILGRGAMGVVYKARQDRLKRFVALKMILTGEIATEPERKRFRIEAEAAARLGQHPNIVQIHDYGECGGRPYLAMEFVDGCNLGKQVSDRTEEPTAAAEAVRTLASAMHFAHQHSVVHRDLKPGNIMVTAAGVLKVTDFGLAKRLDVGGDTYTGAVLGTPSYMAPEQARGENDAVGPAADIYALGGILYRLLTGSPPFRGTNSADILDQVINRDPISPQRLQPGVPRDLETICLKCLHKEPARRYATAAGLAEDLENYLANRPIRARPVGQAERLAKWVRRHKLTSALLSACALAGLLSLTFLLLWMASDAAAKRRELGLERQRLREVAEERDRTSKAERAYRNAVSRQALREAFRSLQGDNWPEAVLRSVDPLQAGKWDQEDEHVHRIRIAALMERLARMHRVWREGRPVGLLALSPDGHRLAVTAGHEIHVHDLRAKEPGGPSFSPFAAPSTIALLQFSPDGHRLLVASGPQPPKPRTGSLSSPAEFEPLPLDKAPQAIEIWDPVEGRRVLGPLQHDGPIRAATYSPDGQFIATAGSDRTVRLWDADTGQAAQPPMQHADAVVGVRFSPDGRFLVTQSADYRRRTIDQANRLWRLADGQEMDFARDQLRPGQVITHLVFTPDGRSFITARDHPHDKRERGLDLWDLSTLKKTPLRFDEAFRDQLSRVMALDLGQDGRTVMLVVGDGVLGTAGLYDLETGEKIRRRAYMPLYEQERLTTAAFSRDGRSVVTMGASSDRPLGAPSEILAWDARYGQRLTRPVPLADRAVAWTHTDDGRRVVLATHDNLVVVWDHPPAAMERVRSLEHPGGVGHVAFSPNNQQLLTVGLDRTARVWDHTRGQLLAALGDPGHEGVVHHAAFSPDGRTLATAGADKTARLWDLLGREQPRVLRHDAPVARVEFLADGEDLATLSGGDFLKALNPGPRPQGRVKLWNVAAGATVDCPALDEQPVAEMGPVPGRKWFVTATRVDKADVLRVWDARAGAIVGPPVTVQGFLQRFALDPEGRRLATAAGTEVRVWDVGTGEPCLPPIPCEGRAWWVAYSPDGRRLVTAAGPLSPDPSVLGQLRCWSADDGSPATRVAPIGTNVRQCALSRSGRLVATASSQGLYMPQTNSYGLVSVWDTDSGELVMPPVRLPDPVYDAVFSPNEDYVACKRVAADARNVDAVVVRVPRDLRDEDTLRRHAELLSCQRLDDTGEVVPLQAEEILERFRALSASGDLPPSR